MYAISNSDGWAMGQQATNIYLKNATSLLECVVLAVYDQKLRQSNIVFTILITNILCSVIANIKSLMGCTLLHFL
jgi:hypothetical protein